MPKIAVIYLSYNGKSYLPEILAALRALDYPKDRIEFIFVDNASQDGSQDYLRQVPDITFFENDKNGGFADGNNIGIRYAFSQDFNYVFLHNNDLKLHPDALKEAVALAESDERIGSVQSLMTLWQHPDIVNSTGGMVHFFGFGYVRDNGCPVSHIHREDGEEIAYASGAAVLYRASVLAQVGLLDPYYFMYHEDLELGWRIRLAGYKNVLSVRSRAYHDYAFKRSIKKFFWMERNRWLVHLSHLKWKTLLLLLPFMLLLEIPLFLFACNGGWWKEKGKVYASLMSPTTWKYLVDKRRESMRLRRVSDREIVRLFTARIDHQDTNNPVVRYIGNPLLVCVWTILRAFIRW